MLGLSSLELRMMAHAQVGIGGDHIVAHDCASDMEVMMGVEG